MDQEQIRYLEQIGALEFNRRMMGLAIVSRCAKSIKEDPRWIRSDRKVCWYLLKQSWQMEQVTDRKYLAELIEQMKHATTHAQQELYCILETIEQKWQYKKTTILAEWIGCIQNQHTPIPYTDKLYAHLKKGSFDNRHERTLCYLCECLKTLSQLQQVDPTTLIAIEYHNSTCPECALKKKHCVLLDIAHFIDIKYNHQFKDYLLRQKKHWALHLTQTTIHMGQAVSFDYAHLHHQWKRSIEQDIVVFKQLISELDNHYQSFLQTYPRAILS